MTQNEIESIKLIESITSNENTEEYSIPLDISDIINICKDFANLGWQIQNQVENILEFGIEESIKSGSVKKESLPKIKFFLNKIVQNPYFGDAASRSQDCIKLILQYEDKHKVRNLNLSN